jgi:hypothetical protein
MSGRSPFPLRIFFGWPQKNRHASISRRFVGLHRHPAQALPATRSRSRGKILYTRQGKFDLWAARLRSTIALPTQGGRHAV